MTDVGVAGLHHVGLVVSNLSRSIAFYCEHFGASVELHLTNEGGPEMATLHALERADYDLAFLRAGNSRIELVEFHEPADGVAVRRRACDLGAAHVAFEVADAHATYERLSAAGVAFTAQPLVITEGGAAGYVLAFCLDPDGNRIELLQTPGD
jgi:catechol 2,3-dioxygenase-like lactoylglutathione lyase family enzyme